MVGARCVVWMGDLERFNRLCGLGVSVYWVVWGVFVDFRVV